MPVSFYVTGTYAAELLKKIDNNDWTAPSEAGVRMVARRQAKESGQMGAWPVCKVTIEELEPEQTTKR